MQAGLHRDPLSLHEITQQNSQQSNGNHEHQRETTIAILLADLPSHKVQFLTKLVVLLNSRVSLFS
uniref:Uncharacterized protein n=1 Tax=Aegilops tauschii subsp. strangulata TaxID=200361 RepID=A0A453CFH0_AEGTS